MDSDFRGAVVLRDSAAQPPIASTKATVSFGDLPRGESIITEVTRQCFMPDGILYYYVKFDESREGWVDVDYLSWEKVAEAP